MSPVRAIAKTLHGLVLVWTIFCGASWLLGMVRLSNHATGTSTVIAMAAAFGTGFWVVAWLVGLVAGELVAIGLALTTTRDCAQTVSRREWVIAGMFTAIAAATMSLPLVLALINTAAQLNSARLQSSSGDVPIRRTPVTSPIDVHCTGNPDGLQFVVRYEPTGTLTLAFGNPLPSSAQIDQRARYCEQVLRAAYDVPRQLTVRATYRDGAGTDKLIR